MTVESAAPEPMPSATLPRQSSLLAEVAKTLGWAFLIVLIVRTFLWQPFNIPSGSMTDTLLVGDYVWVSKTAYGYSRYSFPFGFPPFEGRIFASEPLRGDVVVFKLPRDNATDYIKRVIGLPGDRVQMKKGRLYLNGAIVPQEFLGEEKVDTPARGEVTAKRYRETLPSGRSYTILDTWEASEGDNTPELTVPPSHYFMMGDNRDDSTDSRFAPKGTPGGAFLESDNGVGFVPDDNLVGRADAVFFSAGGSAAFWEVWKFPAAIRWDRIFRPIE